MNKSPFIVAILLLSIIFSSNISAQIKRTTVNRSPSSRSKDMMALLQGRWSSLEDKKTFFQIEGDKQIDIYGRDILDTATINFYDDCPKRISADDEKRRSGKYLVVEVRHNDFYCYSVDKISSQQLVLTYLPKGSILKYKKVPTIKLQATTPEETED
ncbi:MAG TPA: hypothetical protein VF623_04350 [Segetibacter sp.]|jgi:hypothetical protein